MKHVAICTNPLFDLILSGDKTIESRWANRRIAPYGKVNVGDEIFFKESGKDIVAKSVVKRVEYFEVTELVADKINEQYGKQICIDRFDNWQACRLKKYCTLIWLGQIKRLKPKKFEHRGMSAWICID